jgi:hypothetical protein
MMKQGSEAVSSSGFEKAGGFKKVADESVCS